MLQPRGLNVVLWGSVFALGVRCLLFAWDGLPELLSKRIELVTPVTSFNRGTSPLFFFFWGGGLEESLMTKIALHASQRGHPSRQSWPFALRRRRLPPGTAAAVVLLALPVRFLP